MARYTGPATKKSRRLRVDLVGDDRSIVAGLEVGGFGSIGVQGHGGVSLWRVGGGTTGVVGPGGFRRDAGARRGGGRGDGGVVEIVAVVGRADRMKHYPRQLSGGQEQRVGIARAIVTDPTLLLCDEPTGDLDRKSGDEVLDLLQTLNREQGKTIIMVTHDPHAAQRATRTLHLDKGVLVAAA